MSLPPSNHIRFVRSLTSCFFLSLSLSNSCPHKQHWQSRYSRTNAKTGVLWANCSFNDWYNFKRSNWSMCNSMWWSSKCAIREKRIERKKIKKKENKEQKKNKKINETKQTDGQTDNFLTYLDSKLCYLASWLTSLDYRCNTARCVDVYHLYPGRDQANGILICDLSNNAWYPGADLCKKG